MRLSNMGGHSQSARLWGTGWKEYVITYMSLCCPAFLKKEGMFSRKGTPCYKLIRVYVSKEEKEVLTFLGLKPKPIEHLEQDKIVDTIRYVGESIEGAKEFHVRHFDMTRVRKVLEEMKERMQKNLKAVSHETR